MKKPQKSQLAVCSWCLRPERPSDLADTVARTGLRDVQLHLNPVFMRFDAWGSVRRILATRGLTIVSGMFNTEGEDYSSLESIRRTGGIVPDEHWEANWKIVDSAARVAADLGLTMVSSHAGFLPEDPHTPEFHKLVGRIARIAERLGQAGITLLFETGQEKADTLLGFLRALRDTGVNNVAVNFDPANMILYGMGDPVGALRKLMPHVRQIHIKDGVSAAAPGQWGREVHIGKGEVDWQAFIRVLAENDFAGPMAIEREAGPDPVSDIRAAVEHLAPLLG